MLRKSLDILMFTTYGFFKASFLLSIVCLSGLFFFKLKIASDVKIGSNGPVGILIGSSEKDITKKSSIEKNTGLKTGEAEIFKLILRLSDEISTTEARKLAKLIRKECDNYDLDPFLILAIIQVESRFDPIAVSNKGAVGLMQVMPGTADFIAEDLGVSINSGKSLYDPLINVKLGIYYFSILLDRFETTHDALVAYNVGPTRFSNTKSLQKRTPSYVRKVLNFKNLLEDETIKTQKS